MIARFFGVRRGGRKEFQEELARIDEKAWKPGGTCEFVEKARESCGDSAIPYLVGDAISRLRGYAQGLCSHPELLDQAIAELTMARVYTHAVESQDIDEGVTHEGRIRKGLDEGLEGQQQGERSEGRDPRASQASGDLDGSEDQAEVGHGQLRVAATLSLFLLCVLVGCGDPQPAPFPAGCAERRCEPIR